MPIRINIDQVPLAARQDELFKHLLAEMTEAFSDPSYVFEVCLHEVAHGHYMEATGVKNLRLYGPTIAYDPRKQPPFVATSARIQGDDLDDSVKVDLAFVLGVAKHHVAGGVAIRRILGVQYGGDEQDKETFLARCAHLPPELRHITPDELWKMAETAVEKDLQDSGFQARLRAKADEYVRLLHQL